MTRKAVKILLPVFEAYANGKTIQVKSANAETWQDISEPIFNSYPEDYRIKPEPHRFWVLMCQNINLLFTEKEQAEKYIKDFSVTNYELLEVVEQLKD
jgi:hypothetical protein